MKTILFVDDDYAICNLVTDILSQKYNVIVASSGREAIKIFKENSSEIDLVITDLVMPNMTGLEVVEIVSSLSPKVKTMVFSGAIAQIDKYIKNRNTKIDKFLSKPISIVGIEKAVTELLGD